MSSIKYFRAYYRIYRCRSSVPVAFLKALREALAPVPF